MTYFKPSDDRLLPPAKVAQMYGVDPKTVRRWALEGKISYIMTPGGHRRFSQKAIEEQLARTAHQ